MCDDGSPCLPYLGCLQSVWHQKSDRLYHRIKGCGDKRIGAADKRQRLPVRRARRLLSRMLRLEPGSAAIKGNRVGGAQFTGQRVLGQ